MSIEYAALNAATHPTDAFLAFCHDRRVTPDHAYRAAHDASRSRLVIAQAASPFEEQAEGLLRATIVSEQTNSPTVWCYTYTELWHMLWFVPTPAYRTTEMGARVQIARRRQVPGFDELTLLFLALYSWEPCG